MKSKSDRTYDIIVIGAGHNGLVAAAYLARAGLSVLVLERRPQLGGVATTEEIAPGFLVDTLLHHASMVRPALVQDLFLKMNGFELVPTPALRFCPFPDGSQLTLWRDPAASQEAIDRLSPADAQRFPAYDQRMAQFAQFVEEALAQLPPDVGQPGLEDLVNWLPQAARLRRLGARDMYELLRFLPLSIYEWMEEWFGDRRVRAALGTAGIWHLQQGPRAGGTAFHLLYHTLGHRAGGLPEAGLVRGGVGRLIEALAAVARYEGAEIRPNSPVAAVFLEGRQAAGVELEDGRVILAKKVVSSVDPFHTFRELVPPYELPPTFNRAVGNIKFRGVTAKVNLALNGLPRFSSLAPGETAPLAGRIQISPSLDEVERAYDDAKYGRLSAEPILEITIPTLHDPSLAPPGKHTLSILVQYAPYRLREGSWAEQQLTLAERTISTLARYAPNLPELIVAQQVLTPADLAERFTLHEAGLYHGQMTLDQLLFMRPVPGWSHYQTPIPGLYLCGAGTHPGGGLTGEPGRLAASVILRELQKAPLTEKSRPAA